MIGGPAGNEPFKMTKISLTKQQAESNFALQVIISFIMDKFWSSNILDLLN